MYTMPPSASTSRRGAGGRAGGRAGGTPTSTPPVYHADWFSEHVPSYDQILGPRLARSALVVGTHEGRSVEWLVQRGATHVVVLEEPVSKDDESLSRRCLSTRGVEVCVSDKEVRATLKANLRIFASSAARIRLIEAPLIEGFSQLRKAGLAAPFDAILIDPQSSRHAMECAVLAFQVLKPGGVMVFTNYTHGRTHDASCPRRGIDGFLDAYAYEIKLLRVAFHLFLERRAIPLLTLTPCRAEVFDTAELR